jgi:hypothetical protein
VFLGDNLVSWSSKHQNVVTRLSAEVGYHVVANNVVEVCWLHQRLVELNNPLSQATLVYCDNVSIVYLSTNPVQHQHCRRGRSCPPRSETHQFVDIFNKGVPSPPLGVLEVSV